MRDLSASYWFSVGDSVRVVADDVEKAGVNLQDRVGKVVQTWEKCDVDPTCCCAEQVDPNMAVRVEFEGTEADPTMAGTSFMHYFGEAELIKVKHASKATTVPFTLTFSPFQSFKQEARQGLFLHNQEDEEAKDESLPFDGMSCAAFKMNHLQSASQTPRGIYSYEPTSPAAESVEEEAKDESLPFDGMSCAAFKIDHLQSASQSPRGIYSYEPTSPTPDIVEEEGNATTVPFTLTFNPFQSFRRAHQGLFWYNQDDEEVKDESLPFDGMSSMAFQSVNDAQGGMDRRAVAKNAFASLVSLLVTGVTIDQMKTNTDTSLLLVDDDNWQGTTLEILSLDEAFELSIQNGGNTEVFPFAHWPDPILRRQASRLAIPSAGGQQDTSQLLTKLQSVARTLQRTARKQGAVGLAAQQCGLDVSLVYLQSPNKNPAQDTFFLNPRIVHRSPERDMRVWKEECLVLPPSFRATLLRDASVTVEYEALFSSSQGTIRPFSTQQITLTGELARAVQHEMNHDVGILIVDHVGLDELPPSMQKYEREGHSDRMDAAFRRDIFPSSLPAASSTNPAIQYHERSVSWQEAIVPRAYAAEPVTNNKECDEKCLAERKRIIEERRAMMRQSRTNTQRQDVFELSKQRAAMYNTTYRGMNCPPVSANGVTIPCI